jgi:GR25 family glycosyltransferase involved in LPS biosynthesis
VFLNVSEPNPTMFQWISARDQYLTGAYILSLGGAKRLLQMFSHEYASADWMTTRLQTQGHSYTYFPWLVIQEGYESTIGSGVEADHAKVLRCLGEIHYDLNNYI